MRPFWPHRQCTYILCPNNYYYHEAFVAALTVRLPRVLAGTNLTSGCDTLDSKVV